MPNPINPGTVKETNDLLGQQSALWRDIANSTKMMAENLSKASSGLKNTSSQVQENTNYFQRAAATQVQATNDIATAQQNASASSVEYSRNIRSLGMTFDEALTPLERFQRQLEEREASFAWFEITDAIGLAENTLRGFGKNLSGTISSANAGVMTLVSGIGTLASGLFNVGKALIAIPFSLLSSAAEEGNKIIREKGLGGGGGGGTVDNSFRDALEEVREKLGDIATGEGKLVVDMYKQINAQQKNVAGSGLSLATIFGKQADALKAMAELYGELGNMAYVFSDELATSAAEMAVFQKGLGLAGEDMRAFGKLALANGTKIVDVLEEAGRVSLTMGKKFGISSKLISKDLAYMAANSSRFGVMTMKSMAATSAYVRKLGIDIKALEGVMGVFDDFESGAQAAAKLSQAFGIQLDSMKMMKASGAEQVEMIKEAFAKSGQDISTMSRQQLKVLQDSTGLGEDMMQVLAKGSKGIKLDEAQDAAADATSAANKSLMDQSKILKELAANIKRIPGADGGGGGSSAMSKIKKEFTSFFDAFIYGFGKGIKSGEVYERLMMNITEAIYTFQDAGKDVGKYFKEAFPEVEEIMKSLSGIFDPANFKMSTGQLTDLFKNLFKDLKDPATATKAFENFFDGFKKWFETMFDNAEAESSISKAVESLIRYMGHALFGATEYLMQTMATVITEIANFLSGTDAETELAKATETGIGAALKKAFLQLKFVVVRNWPVLEAAIMKLFDIAYEKLKPYLIKGLMYYFGFIFAVGIVGGLGQAVAAAGVQLMIGKVTESMKMGMGRKLLNLFTWFGKSAGEAAQAGTAQGLAKAGEKAVDGAPTGIAPKADDAKAAVAGTEPAASMKDTVKGIADINSADITKAAKNLLIMAGTFLLVAIGFVAAIALMGKIVMAAGIDAMLAGVAALAAVIISLIVVIQSTKLMTGVEQAAATMTKALPLAGIAGLLLLGFTLIAALAAKTGVTPELISSLTFALGAIILGLIGLSLAAYLLAAVDPTGGLVVGGILIVAGTILLVSLGVFVGALAAFVKLAPGQDKLKKAEEITISLGTVLSTIAGMIFDLMKIGFTLLNPITLIGVAAGAIAIGKFMKEVGPAFNEIFKAFGEVKIDAGSVEPKINILKGTFAVLDPLFKIVDKVMEQSSGWETPTKDAANNVKTQLDAITGFIYNVLDSLGRFISIVMEASKSIDVTDESSLKRAEIFAKILEPVASLANAFIGAIAGMEGGGTKIGYDVGFTGVSSSVEISESLSQKLESIGAFLLGKDGSGGFMKSLMEFVPEIVKAINDISILKGLKPDELEALMKKSELVGKMISGVVELSEMFSSIASIAKDIGTTKTTTEGVFSDEVKESINLNSILVFRNTFTGVMKTLQELIPDIVTSFNKIPAVDLKGSKDPGERINAVTSALSAMMNGITKLTSMFDSNEKATEASTKLTSMSETIKTISGTAAGIMTKILTDFSGLPSLDPKKFEGIAKGMDAISNLGNYIYDIRGAVASMQELSRSNLVGIVSAAITNIKEIDTELGKISNVRIDGRIEKIGKALALKPDTLKIDNKPVNLNVSINFTLDAKDLTSVVTDMQAQLAISKGSAKDMKGTATI